MTSPGQTRATGSASLERRNRLYSHDKTKGGSELGMENATLEVQGNIYQHPCKTVMDERHHDPSTTQNPDSWNLPSQGETPTAGKTPMATPIRWRKIIDRRRWCTIELNTPRLSPLLPPGPPPLSGARTVVLGRATGSLSPALRLGNQSYGRTGSPPQKKNPGEQSRLFRHRRGVETANSLRSRRRLRGRSGSTQQSYGRDGGRINAR